MRQNGQIATRQIGKAKRRMQALELRKSGLSLRQIAYQLEVSHTQARNNIQAALDELAAANRVTTEQYRALQNERLHDLLGSCYAAALRGELDAIKVASTLTDQLSKLNGLYGVSPIGIDDGVAIVGTPEFAAIHPHLCGCARRPAGTAGARCSAVPPAGGSAAMIAQLRMACDPVELFRHAIGEPDAWQIDVLRSTATQVIINTSRQAGKKCACGTGRPPLVVSPTGARGDRGTSLFQALLSFSEVSKTIVRVAKPSV